MNREKGEEEMIKKNGHPTSLQDQTGATVVFIAVMGTLLLGFVALAVNIGYLVVSKNELQNAADAAALAACRKLGHKYQKLTYAAQLAYICDDKDQGDIRAVAREVGGKNSAAAKLIEIMDEDIEIGDWSSGSFSAQLDRPNAVRVTARRDSEANESIPTFFARVLGIYSMSVTADAIASLTGQSTTVPGELELPVGISRKWFDDHTCKDQIKFSPTEESCAGWTTFTERSNTDELRDIFANIIADKEVSEGTIAGETEFYFTGGDNVALFPKSENVPFNENKPNMLDVFQAKGDDVDKDDDWIYYKDASSGDLTQVHLATDHPDETIFYDATGYEEVAAVPLYDAEDPTSRLEYPDGTLRNEHAWETTVVVYENLDRSADCSNPNQTKRVVGYARIRLTDVVGPPDNLIAGELICNYVDNEDSRGGGAEVYGSMGSIPGLVE